MTYSDNNPERRNLTVLSLVIVIFYLGKGYLLKPEISFTLVNIGFHNQEILVKLIWVMLFWFLFRYVITNRHSHGDDLNSELNNTGLSINLDYAPVRKYMINNGQESNVNKLKSARIFCHTPGAWYLGFPKPYVQMKGLDGYLITKLYLLKILFKHRATTDYYSPYLLFMFAVLLGINEHLINISSMTPVLLSVLIVSVVEVLYYIRN